MALALDIAHSEALALLRSMLDSGDSPDVIRSLIRCDKNNTDADHRRKVLLYFEILLWKHRKTALPPILRGLIVPMLKAGVSQREVCARVPVGPTAVRVVAKEIGAAFSKPHGRGRRFTPEFREQIRQAVASGRRSVDIELELGIDSHSVRDMRHELGDLENRKFRKKLSAEQIAQAEAQLRKGDSWRDVAASFNVAPSTLLKRCHYRKLQAFRRFTFAEIEEVREGISRGEGARCIADRIRRPRSSVIFLANRLRKENPNLPQRAGLLPKVRKAIVRARMQGHSFAKIARRVGLTAGGVFRIVQRENKVCKT